MKPRTGTLIQRGGWYSLKFVVSGAVKVVALHTRDAEKADSLRGEIMAGVNGDAAPPERVRLRIADMWGVFLSSPCRKNCSSRTLSDYTGIFRGLLDWLPGSVVYGDELAAGFAGRYVAELQEGRSPSTVNKHVNALAMIWSVINKDSTMRGEPVPFAVVPWQYVARMAPGPVVHRRAFSVDQLRVVYRGAPDDEWRDAIGMAAHTGLRRADCLGLKADSFNIERGVLEVVPVKTARRGSVARVGMTDLVQDIVQRRGGGGYLFPRLAGLMRDDSSYVVTREFQKILVDLGFKTQSTGAGRAACLYGLHSFRHTFKSLLIQAGVHPALLDLALCHGQSSVKAAYVHVRDEDLLAAVRCLPDLRA